MNLGSLCQKESFHDERCYLCRSLIPHNLLEHSEVLVGGLKARHKGVYADVDRKVKRQPHDHAWVSSDLSVEERIQLYKVRGMSSKKARSTVLNRDRAKAWKAAHPERFAEMRKRHDEKARKKLKDIKDERRSETLRKAIPQEG